MTGCNLDAVGDGDLRLLPGDAPQATAAPIHGIDGHHAKEGPNVGEDGEGRRRSEEPKMIGVDRARRRRGTLEFRHHRTGDGAKPDGMVPKGRGIDRAGSEDGGSTWAGATEGYTTATSATDTINNKAPKGLLEAIGDTEGPQIVEGW